MINTAKQRAFLIAPIRNITPEYEAAIAAQVKDLERDYSVYWPARDTDQRPISGLPECRQNMKAMKRAKIVFVIWDGKSQGVLFDLGMAFALHKPIQTLIGYMPSLTRSKSFQNLVYAWEELGQG